MPHYKVYTNQQHLTRNEEGNTFEPPLFDVVGPSEAALAALTQCCAHGVEGEPIRLIVEPCAVPAETFTRITYDAHIEMRDVGHEEIPVERATPSPTEPDPTPEVDPDKEYDGDGNPIAPQIYESDPVPVVDLVMDDPSDWPTSPHEPAETLRHPNQGP